MKLLVIGERSREGSERPIWCELCAVNPFQWLLNSRALGAFCSSQSAAAYAGRLSSVGIDLGNKQQVDSLNLLPPDPRPGAWDPLLARSVADELRVRLYEPWLPSDSPDRADLKLDWGRADWQRNTWKYNGVVLCGQRVAEAMDCGEMTLWSADGGTLLLPHPRQLYTELTVMDLALRRAIVSEWIKSLS